MGLFCPVEELHQPEGVGPQKRYVCRSTCVSAVHNRGVSAVQRFGVGTEAGIETEATS